MVRTIETNIKKKPVFITINFIECKDRNYFSRSTVIAAVKNQPNELGEGIQE
jgi:hypothetical protein